MSRRTLLFFCTIILLAFPQAIQAQQVPAAGDCPEAISLNIGEEYRYGASPVGPGERMEIQSHKHDPLYFEKEHNTVWYKFKAPSAGMLTMELVPFDPKDDYDFLIFKAEDASICDAVLSKESLPVLTNISRTSKKEKGMTGLRPNSGKQFVAEGPGQAFSRPLQVQTGDVFYIVVDNVYDGGDGHTILLNLEKMIHVSGEVRSDEDGSPLRAEIIYEEKETGKVLVEAESDPLTGKFDLDLPLKDGVDYNLVINADSHFFKMQTFNSKTIRKQSLMFRVIMPKLVIDKTFPLPDINFQPGVAIFLKSAYPTLRALNRFMRKNSNIDIALEGHVNGMNGGVRIPPNPIFEQNLSEQRALAVKRYLESKDIAKNRMTNKGFGAVYMLFPQAKSGKEMSANRRVEVRMGGYSTPGKGMEFVKGSWDEVKELAGKQDKFIMVDAYTTWCGPCKFMSKTVFTDPNVAAYFDPRFVSYKLDMETAAGQAFAEEFDVKAYPTLLFFNSAGEILSKVEGAKNQPDLIALGKSVVNLKKMTDEYEAGNRTFDFLFAYVNTLATTGDIPAEIMATYKSTAPRDQWFSDRNFNFLLGMIGNYRHPFFKELYDNREEFAGVSGKKKVDGALLDILAGVSVCNAGANRSKADLAEIEAMIVGVTGTSDHKSVYQARMGYATQAKDLPLFESAANSMLKINDNDWRTYLTLAKMAAGMDMEGSFELGMKWMSKSISLQKNATNTLAEVVLLTKYGDMGKAEKLMKTARELGIIEGRSSEEYDLIEEKLFNQASSGAVMH